MNTTQNNETYEGFSIEGLNDFWKQEGKNPVTPVNPTDEFEGFNIQALRAIWKQEREADK